MLEINSISVIIYLYSGNDKIMEVVSTSNLVSSENVKKKTKQLWILLLYHMIGQMGTYAYMQTSSYS